MYKKCDPNCSYKYDKENNYKVQREFMSVIKPKQTTKVDEITGTGLEKSKT